MTRVQEAVMRYIGQSFSGERVTALPVDDDKVMITGGGGRKVMLTTNIYGDIMDADTKAIYAVSNLPHEIDKIGLQMPGEWRSMSARNISREIEGIVR